MRVIRENTVHEEAAKTDPAPSVVRYRGGKSFAAAMSAAMGGLSPGDASAVILALVDQRGDRGATEEDMSQALEWAHGAFIEWALLRLVIEGRARIDFDADGEAIFFHTPEPAPS